MYIVLVNGKLAKNATMDPVLFFLVLHMNAFFGLKTDFNQNSVKLGMISVRQKSDLVPLKESLDFI